MFTMNPRFVLHFTDDDREKGSLLIISVLILAVVTVIGVMSSKTAVVETQISTYDKMYRGNWALTDGTTDMLMPKVIEKGLERRAPVDFPPKPPAGADDQSEVPTDIQGFRLTTLDTADDTGYLLNQPSGDCRTDQVNDNKDEEDQNSAQLKHVTDGDVLLKVYSTTELQPGGALQIAEGYHGLGKGIAGGGAVMAYKIRGVGRGKTPAAGKVRHTTAWMHVIR